MDPPIASGETWRTVVYGTPVGQGSLNAYPVTRFDPVQGKRVPVLKDNGLPVVAVSDQKKKKLAPWRQDIAEKAVKDWGPRGECVLDEPVIVALDFFVGRPDGQYGTGRNLGILKDSALLYPESTGDDVDKMARAVLDALTGIVIASDKRVVALRTRRRYGSPRVEIAVKRVRARTIGDLRRLRGEDPDLAEVLAGQLQLELAAV